MPDVRLRVRGRRGFALGLVVVLPGEAGRVKRRMAVAEIIDAWWRLTRRAESGSRVRRGCSGWSGGREPVR